MKNLSAIILILFLLLSCGADHNAQTQDKNNTPTPTTKSKPVHNTTPLNQATVSMQRKVEQDNISKCNSQVSRINDSTLLIKLFDNAAILFVDTLKNSVSDKHVSYMFDTCLSDKGFYVICRLCNDWMDYLLLNAQTGQCDTLISSITVNTSQTKFLCASLDLDAGLVPNGIEVWEFGSFGITRGFSYLEGFKNSGPRDAVWENDTTITFTNVELVKQEDGIEAPVVSPRKIRFSQESWYIDSTNIN